MNLANKITLARIALIPLVIILLLLTLNGLALLVFLFLACSDYVDGYIARKYNQVSDLGKYLDPLADKVLVICVLITLVGLGSAGIIPVVLLAAREFIVSGLRIHVAKHGVIMAASPSAKWKTVLQMTAIALLILGFSLGHWLLWLSVIAALLTGVDYAWQSKILESLKLS